MLACLMVFLVIFSTLFATFYGVSQAQAKGPSAVYHGQPNRANQHSLSFGKANPAIPLPGPKQPIAGKPLSINQVLGSPHFTPSMQPLTITLSPDQPVDVTSSDGLLEIKIPAGAVTASDITTAGGALRLAVTEIAPPSGSTTGGLISLGTYLTQVQNGQGREIASASSQGLRQSVTLIYHWPGTQSAIPLTRFVAAVNGSLPHGVTATHWGKYQSAHMAYDSTHRTLSVTLPLGSGPSNAASFDTNSPEGYFGQADQWQADLSAGALTNEIPLDIPSGPGGLTPPIHLAYDSASVATRYNNQAAAPWVGQGWNLDMGEITWSEVNIGSCPKCNADWHDTWHLSDPYGTSAELIPPEPNVATFFDDTPNVWWNPSTHTYVNPIITWQEAPDSHTKIVSIVSPNNFGMPANAPCFRVWLPNGAMEEFGCTANSVQYYYAGSSGTTAYISAWKLDLITDPQGNQIPFTYQADTQPNPNANIGQTYPRDLELQSIQWDAPGCLNAQTACSGSSWNPRMQLVFNASNAVANAYPSGDSCGNPGKTNGDYNPRCDDALGTLDFIPPAVENTLVLNTLQVQYMPPGSSSWSTLRTYQFSYTQTTGTTITDPVTGLPIGIAGKFWLTKFQEIGDDGTTSLPAQTFTYADENAHYENIFYNATPSTNCGPSWNKNCYLWSETYNTGFMTSADNGQGMVETFAYSEARTNQHGVNTGLSEINAFSCDGQESKGYPCDVADDQGWSRWVLTSRTQKVISATNVTVASTWSYNYYLNELTAKECADCTVGMYWGNADDGDYLDYYNGVFMGFVWAQVINPDNSVADHYYYTTEGWGVYDTSKGRACQDAYQGGTCMNDPYWDLSNAANGHESESQTFAYTGSSYVLLQEMQYGYTVTCPPVGVSPSDPNTVGNLYGNWDSHLVSEIDMDNPVAACDVMPHNTITWYAEGNNSPTYSNTPEFQASDVYDSYGQLTSRTTTGNDLDTTPTTVQTQQYLRNDNVTTTFNGTTGSATGTSIVDTVAFSDVEDGSSNQKACAYTSYDRQPWASGTSTKLTLGEPTETDQYATCASGGGTGKVTTTATYDQYGNQLATTDADANGGVGGHTTSTCTFNSVRYTACASYDTTFDALPTTQTNALGQQTTTAYGTAGNESGLWPTSTTDANNQTTSMTYDALGRVTSTVAPGDTTSNPTTTMIYDIWCNGGTSLPCMEVDTLQNLGGGNTVRTRAYYDGDGRLVETRKPGPAGSGDDVIQYALYNAMGDRTFLSQPFFALAETGGPGPSTYYLPTGNETGASTTYDSLGRTLTTKDPLSATTTTAYTEACDISGTSDSACYRVTTTVDANGHQSAAISDALGRARYAQQWDGTSGGYTLYRTVISHYDYLGDVVSTTSADGSHTATATYDMLKRETAFSDPDLGSSTLSYDPNGNLTSSADPRGTSGTIYLAYDGLNRVLWKSTNSNGSSPLASYSYDSTAGGTMGVGRLTGESFASGPGQSVTGSYAFTYDARGRQTGWSMTIGGTTYPFSMGYNDANQQTTLTFPDGDLVTTSYGPQDWLSGVSEKLSGTTTTLVSGISYDAAQQPTSATVGNGTYTWNLSYDGDLRLSEIRVALVSPSTTLFDESRQFDAVGNVVTADTTLPAGTDNQTFCYDSANRLVWAGSTGTPSCGTPLTPGTLTSASYTQTYAYDTLDRLTTGPLGAGYTYGDTSHLDAVTSAPSYSASYDAAGDMTGRNGQVLGYDALRQLISWQNQATNPTSTASYAYDGEGHRVQQVAAVTSNGITTTTTTTYVGAYAEYATIIETGNCQPSCSAGSATTNYYAAGVAQVEDTGSLSYLVSDDLGSVSMALSSSGSVTADQLFAPYGASRYSSGTMPTVKGFTGQRLDPSGLTYFNARYYDASVGAFVTADAAQGPNRYGYVRGNPETFTDPTGKGICEPGNCYFGGGGHSGGGNPPPVSPPAPPPTPTSGGTTPTNCPPSGSPCPPTSHSGQNVTCNGRCWGDMWQIVWGLLQVGTAVGATIGACSGLALLCEFWFRAMSPIFLHGLHDILSGVDSLYQQLGGNTQGSLLSVILSGGKVAVDFLQFFTTISNISSAISVLRSSQSAIGSLGQILYQTARGAVSGVSLVTNVAFLVNLVSGPMIGDFSEFSAAFQAYAAAQEPPQLQGNIDITFPPYGQGNGIA